MTKILQIQLSWLKRLYAVHLYGKTQATMPNKIIYGWEDINLMKKNPKEKKWLKSCY